MNWFSHYTLPAALALVYVTFNLTTTVKNENKNVLLTPITTSTTEKAKPVGSHILVDISISDSIKYGVLPSKEWSSESFRNSEYESSPGCPPPIDGFPWVYYGSPPKCFIVGFEGPCEIGQKVLLQRESLYGICGCDCLMETMEHPLYLPETSGRYITCQGDQANFIYDTQDEKCYEQFSQGPCAVDQVVIEWTEDSLTCLQKCDENQSDWKEIHNKGLCIPILPERRVEAKAAPLPTGACPSEKRWSQLLQLCIPRIPKQWTPPIG